MLFSFFFVKFFPKLSLFKNLSVFIGCVAPLQSDRLHTEATVKYMEELMSVDIYLQNRVATEEELIEYAAERGCRL